MSRVLKRSPSGEAMEEDELEETLPNRKVLYEGGYNAADYANLSVSNEIQQIFSHITFYTPQVVKLETRLKPFIPEYIASVGDIDSFIKIERPDGKEENLGLVPLDEPSAKHQSDPSLLRLRLRLLHKVVINDTIEDEENKKMKFNIKFAKNSKDIQNWIKSIDSLHEAQSLTSSNMIQLIQANTRMPEIERLMQELPAPVEQLINDNELLLPDKDLNCTLEEFISIICAILDIPVHNSKIASLHTLFSLYNEFHSSQNFKSDFN